MFIGAGTNYVYGYTGATRESCLGIKGSYPASTVALAPNLSIFNSTLCCLFLSVKCSASFSFSLHLFHTESVLRW